MKRFIDNEQKLYDAVADYKKKCRCGHTQLITPKKDVEFVLCTHCSGRLYLDDTKQAKYNTKRELEEFRFKLAQYLEGSKMVNVRYTR